MNSVFLQRRQNLGELKKDLRQMVMVPLRQQAVHWRSNQDQHVGVDLHELEEHSLDILKNGLDSGLDTERRGSGHVGQKVGEAGDDAGVGGRSNGAQVVSERRHLAAGDDLEKN